MDVYYINFAKENKMNHYKRHMKEEKFKLL